MIVSRQELLAGHARARAQARQQGVAEAQGLFGPRSLSWTINRESAALIGGGAAALMQLAHPYVAHAIAQHSRTRDDILGRFRGTFRHVLTMVFGTADEACDAASRVHAIHTRIHGSITEDIGRFPAGHRYHANQPEALFWVHATLVDVGLRVYETVVRPLTRAEREDYYQASKRFAFLFGIPDRVIPDSHEDFQRYLDATVASDTIAVDAQARNMAIFLLSPPAPWQTPIWRLYRTVTAGFLPQKIRALFGLPFEPRHAREFAVIMRCASAAYRRLPESLRYYPEYMDARAGRPIRTMGVDTAALQRLARALL